MATSSSARKVAKLASRGKGKKVRFSGGTTFPAILTIVGLLMLALIIYAKVSVPGEETGAPQPGDEWVAAYSFRVCDQEYTLAGTGDEYLNEDASTGDPETVQSGIQDNDGIIHYHPQQGGATGRKAKLGVFLDVYGVKLSTDKLDIPVDQLADTTNPDPVHSWDVDDDIFKGTPCEGEEPVIKLRVWGDYTSGSFQDMVTDFRNVRITRNGMVFVIAVVPSDQDYEIPRPPTACDLENYGAIGSGSLCGSGPADTTVDTTVDTTDPVSTDSSTSTTTG